MHTDDIQKTNDEDEAFLGGVTVDDDADVVVEDEVIPGGEVEDTLALLHQGESDEIYEFFVDEEEDRDGEL